MVTTTGRPLLARWWLFGLLAAGSTSVFGYFLPLQRDRVTAGGTRGTKLLDEYLPTWTPDGARQLMESLGPSGRAAYQQFYVGFDFYLPVLTSSLALASFISLMLQYTPRHRWLIATPVVPYLFDVAENLTHYTMAGRWPDVGSVVWVIGPAFTGGKWITLLGVIGVAAWTVRVRLTTRRAAPGGADRRSGRSRSRSAP